MFESLLAVATRLSFSLPLPTKAALPLPLTRTSASHPQHQLGGVAPFAEDSVEETFNAVVRANLRFPTRIFRSVSKEAKDLLRKMLCCANF